MNRTISTHNWTYDEVKKELARFSDYTTVIHHTICLDCEYTPYENMQQVIKWVTDCGFKTVMSVYNGRKFIRVYR